ncbi:MAG TPA: hypothetical protein VGP76_15965 [Planctomycetaceae bacterium]|jgi:hypothetical protein|nr:hypothetical protein [Planctomycetaceae bacterium]
MLTVPALDRWTGVTLAPSTKVLILFAVSGAFGGVLGAIQLTDIPTLIRSPLSAHWNPFRAYNVMLGLIVSSLGGIGGAVAAMLVMALDNKIEFDKVTCAIGEKNKLVYIGMGTVAGFIGFKLLGKIAERVGTWLQIKDEVKRQVERSASEERKRADELVAAITKGISAQVPNARPAAISDAVTALEKVRTDAPDNRTVAMMLSWFYADTEPKNPQKSVIILTETLAAMKSRGTEAAEHVADILYNRACFQYRLAEAAQGAEKDKLRELVYKDLEESVRLRPDNARDAVEEPEDFASMKAEDRFRKLTATVALEIPPAHNPVG